MTSSMPSAPEGVNLSLVQGLRDLADFLEQHPDMPRLHGYVHGHVDTREALERFAATVPDPTESTRYGAVHVEARFGPEVRLEANASLRAVGGREVKPVYEYEPILGGRS